MKYHQIYLADSIELDHAEDYESTLSNQPECYSDGTSTSGSDTETSIG